MARGSPEGAFSSSKLREGNPSEGVVKKNMAVMLDPKDKGDKGIIKDAMDKFPEIREVIEEGCTEGTVQYINTQRRQVSHDAAFAIAAEKDIDIIIALEPNKNLVSNSNWCTDKRTDVAIFFRTKQCRVKNLLAKDGYLVDDLNVKSLQWGSPTADKRGLYLSDWIAESELVVHNTGNTPTFSRGLTQSYIDLTIYTSNLAKDIAKWEVLNEESLSDHHFIYFEVGKKKETVPKLLGNTSRNQLGEIQDAHGMEG
nr:unnamed protein product [Callosobruchus analis]